MSVKGGLVAVEEAVVARAREVVRRSVVGSLVAKPAADVPVGMGMATAAREAEETVVVAVEAVEASQTVTMQAAAQLVVVVAG